MRRFDAEVAQWGEQAESLIATWLLNGDVTGSTEKAREVASGLAEAGRLQAGLVEEITRERGQVEHLLPTGLIRRPDAAALRAAVSQYATLRLCELAYRRWHAGVADLRRGAESLADGIAGTRAALAALRDDLLATADDSEDGRPTSPAFSSEVVADFAAPLRSREALPWDDLASGDTGPFRAGLRTAAERYFAATSATALPADAPRPGLENVGGFYRVLATHRTPASTCPDDGVTAVCDPVNPPFRCSEVEGIRLADAYAAIADGDAWAVAAAARLHVREDVNWGGLS